MAPRLRADLRPDVDEAGAKRMLVKPAMIIGGNNKHETGTRTQRVRAVWATQVAPAAGDLP